jgi:ABC-type dipeptide/oligopeptide/nickel transport system permease subunit
MSRLRARFVRATGGSAIATCCRVRIIIGASIQIGGAVLIESSLAFLGYGVPPPTASWGRMLNEAREQLVRAPHLAIFPGFAIFFTVYSFNMLGDALRDVLDPRLRGSR